MRYVDELLDDIREQIQPEQAVVDEALNRRSVVLTAAASYAPAVDAFGSGSLAHGTAICPIHQRDKGLDADGAILLDQRYWPTLGPETWAAQPPNDTVELYRQHVRGKVIAAGYPNARAETTKRAILVRFRAPLPSGEDPTVDLVLALTRAEGGLWIPNTEQRRWDPSHPKEHTSLLNDVPDDLRVARARAIRLAKAENKRTDPAPLCSFNVEALAWMYLKRTMPLPEALLTLWRGGARDLSRRLTPDPAGVSKPIKVAAREAAAARWDRNADRMQDALHPGTTPDDVRDALAPIWPDYVPDGSGSTPARKAATAAALRTGRPLYASPVGGLAVIGGAEALKTTRSYGAR